MAEFASDILFSIDTALQLKNGLNVETITVSKTLTFQDSSIQILRNETGGMDCNLPALKSGCRFWIKSHGSSTSATAVKAHLGNTIATLTANDSVMVACDDTAWYGIITG